MWKMIFDYHSIVGKFTKNDFQRTQALPNDGHVACQVIALASF